jgi:hypothetical protein
MSENIHIALPRLVVNNYAPAIVRLAAMEIIQTGSYMKPGDWIRNLHQCDLDHLLLLCDAAKDTDTDAATATLVALTMVLVQGEGLDVADGAELTAQMNQLVMFLTLESLGRKGLVDVKYNNISFDPEAGDAAIGETL